METLATFVAVTAMLMVLPGPSALLAVTRTIEGGRRAGLVTVLGLETGLLVHVVAATAGVSAVLAASPTVLTGLRVGGGVFLLYLAWTELRPRRAPTPAPAPRGPRPGPAAPAHGGRAPRRGRRARPRLRPAPAPGSTATGAWWTCSTPRPCCSSWPSSRTSPARRRPGPGPLLVLGLVAVALGLAFDGSYVLATSWLVRRAPARDGAPASRVVARTAGAAYVVAGVAVLAGTL